MRILVIGIKGDRPTGGGTYQAVLLKELARRHEVRVFANKQDLDEKWDLVHCVDLKQLTFQVVKKLRCPLVVDVHDYYWIRYYHFLCLDFPLRFLLQKYRKLKYRFLLKRVAAVIVHGRFMYDAIPHPRKYMNFYFGLDYSGISASPWEERDNLILFVGSDYFRKGLPRLLRAMPLVLESVPDAQLMVIGKDYWYARAFARFLARGLPVQFASSLPRNKVYGTYSQGKVLVLPSEIEALSLVSAEATMAGVPPILTDVGGMPEVVSDGETGYIVPLDDTRLLAKRIIACLTDRETSERLVARGQEFFSQFTIQSMMDRLDEIYRDVVADADKSKCLKWSNDEGTQ